MYLQGKCSATEPFPWPASTPNEYTICIGGLASGKHQVTSGRRVNRSLWVIGTNGSKPETASGPQWRLLFFVKIWWWGTGPTRGGSPMRDLQQVLRGFDGAAVSPPGLSGSPWQETAAGERQTDMPCRERGIEFI